MEKQEKWLKRMRKGIILFYGGMIFAAAAVILLFVLLGTAGDGNSFSYAAVAVIVCAFLSFILAFAGAILMIVAWISGLAWLNGTGRTNLMLADLGIFLFLVGISAATGVGVLVVPAVWYIMHCAVMRKPDSFRFLSDGTKGRMKEQPEKDGLAGYEDRVQEKKPEEKKDLYSLGEVK